jgi:hypothetical protein
MPRGKSSLSLAITEKRLMRGGDRQPAALFSYLSPAARVPPDHPVRPIRVIVATVLQELSPGLEQRYARIGRPSMAPEKPLRAWLLQVLYHRTQ